MIPRPVIRHAAVLVAIAILFAACDTTAPSTAPSPITSLPPRPTTTAAPTPSLTGDALYEAIQQQVIEIRGLEPTGPVARSVIDEPDLVKLISESFDRYNPREYIEAYGRLLQHMGLLDAGQDLRELFVDLNGSQTLGLYDPDTKQLYVVIRSGEFGPTARITFAHEFTHALQDQHYDVRAFQPIELDQGDRAMARVAVLEGDASLLMALWAAENMSAEDLAAIALEANRPEAQAVLDRMPPILREGLMFPYETGLQFAVGQWQAGGWEAIDALYESPPPTTEAILHPEKYAAGEQPIPVAIGEDVAGVLGEGWTERFQDTLGEFQIRIWLREVGGGEDATAAAAGWGGDRLAFYEGPDGAWAYVVETAWDDEAEAAEFVTQARRVVTSLDATSSAEVLQRDPTQAAIVVGSDDAALGRLANALGLAG